MAKGNYDEHCSKVNRQDLPFRSAAQAFAEAKGREDDRKEAQDRSSGPYPTVGVDPQEMRDWKTVRRYEENFGFKERGNSTIDRSDVIEEKNEG